MSLKFASRCYPSLTVRATFTNRLAVLISAGLLAMQLSAHAQVPFDLDTATRTAHSLAGMAPDGVRFYFSAKENANYIAFSVSGNTSVDLRLYRESAGHLDEVWTGKVDHPVTFDFVFLPSEALPSLQIDEHPPCGSGGCSRQLSLYSVQRNKLFSIYYWEDHSATPLPVVREFDDKANDPIVGSWLKNWARGLGVYPLPQRPPTDLDNPDHMEEAWVNDNGHKKSGPVKLRLYDHLSNRASSGTEADDSRFHWTSYST